MKKTPKHLPAPPGERVAPSGAPGLLGLGASAAPTGVATQRHGADRSEHGETKKVKRKPYRYAHLMDNEHKNKTRRSSCPNG